MRTLPARLTTVPVDVPGLWEDLASRFSDVGRPLRVVIHGGYGKDNMGDDSLLHVIRGRVLEHFPDAEIHVVCHGPLVIEERYRDDPLGPVTASHFKSARTLREIVRSDLYIIGGGGIVNKVNVYSGYAVMKALDPKGKFGFIAALMAGWFGAYSLYYGVGIESFPDAVSKWVARTGAQHASLMSVRDPRSLRNLREAGVTRDIVRILDPIASLQPAPAEEADAVLVSLGLPARAQRTRPLVGLNFRWVGDPAIDKDRMIAEIARLARDLNARGCDVIFLPISQHPSKLLEDDLDLGRKLRDALGDASWFTLLDFYPHPTVMMALLGQCDALVLSRLHAVLLSTVMGVPIAIVSYDDKVAEFVELSGQTSRMIDLREFTLERLAPILDDVVPAALPKSESADG